MYSLRRNVTAFLIIGALVLPGAVQAQAVDDIRLQLLRDLVAALQAQLQVLLDERGVDEEYEEPDSYPISEAVFYNDDSFIEEIDAQVVARYRVHDMTIASPSRIHEEYISRVAEVIPGLYHPYIAEFVVFASSQSDIDAFMETALPYERQWRYGVHADVLDDVERGIIDVELIVHEFAHLFSLHEVFTEVTPPDCHEFFEGHGGCVSSDTLYGKFLDEFWDEAQLEQVIDLEGARNYDRALTKFYRENDHDFISRYAASSPAEDFAESFANFVLYEDDEFGSVASEKVSFFNRFSHPRALREEILADL